MTLVKVDETNWGLSATRDRLTKIDPPGKSAYDKFFPSFAQTVRNTNELIDENAAMKARLAVLDRRPF